MQLPVLCCGASLLLLVLPWAGAQPAGGEHGAELRSLQDLLEALGQLREEEGESGPEDELVAGAEDGGSEWDLPGAESGPAGAPLPAPSPPHPAEGQSQWRSLLSAYRRRHFSGCFGTRMERIGAQTGLGCNHLHRLLWVFFRSRRSTRQKTQKPPPESSSPSAVRARSRPVWTSLCRRVAAEGMMVTSFQDNDH
uniref:ANF protein n=1 Tax=Otus sunia TaxID=257818 RepID=A0A8C8B5X4_9STRI